jgi:hypothetical protein
MGLCPRTPEVYRIELDDNLKMKTMKRPPEQPFQKIITKTCKPLGLFLNIALS